MQLTREEGPVDAAVTKIPTTSRTRTVTWEDPLPTAAEGRKMAGADYLRAIADGTFPPPPIAALLGFELGEVGQGWAAFEFEPGEHHYNPIGVVHGGLAGLIADSAMGCAVHSTLPAGAGYTTLEFKVNLVRPITMETGRVRVVGEVVHRGKRVATAEARVQDADGRILAHATTTCLIVGVDA